MASSGSTKFFAAFVFYITPIAVQATTNFKLVRWAGISVVTPQEATPFIFLRVKKPPRAKSWRRLLIVGRDYRSGRVSSIPFAALSLLAATHQALCEILVARQVEHDARSERRVGKIAEQSIDAQLVKL